MDKKGKECIQRYLESIKKAKIGNLGKILERCDRIKKNWNKVQQNILILKIDCLKNV